MNPYEPPAAIPKDAPVVAEGVEQPKTPWGFWATIGFTLLVLAIFLMIQVVVAVGFLLHAGPGPNVEEFQSNGLLLSLCTWASLPFTMGLIALLVAARGRLSLGEYFGLRGLPFAQVHAWLVVLAVFIAAMDGTTWLLRREVVPKFMETAYRTAGWVPLLWATLMIAAPIMEESLFRGFMFRGIQASRPGQCRRGGSLVAGLGRDSSPVRLAGHVPDVLGWHSLGDRAGPHSFALPDDPASRLHESGGDAGGGAVDRVNR